MCTLRVHCTHILRSTQSVADMWKVLVNASTNELIPAQTVSAQRFVMACSTPLRHPYLTQRTFELLTAGMESLKPPNHPRKVVVTLPRNDGTERNGGRR